MSIDDPSHLRAAAWIGGAWNVVMGAGAVLVGLLGRALTPASALPEGDPEMVYLVLSAAHFGPALYGLLVGGVFAAILSTADSQLLVVASTVVRDLWERVLARHRTIDEAHRLRAARWVVLLAGGVALLLAHWAQDLVFWLVLFAWGGLGAALGPALILALYWQRTSRAGALSGMIVGAALTVGWRLWLREPTGIYELVPAFFVSLLTVWVVSLAGGRRRIDPS
jgi:Na+/proline symporter